MKYFLVLLLMTFFIQAQILTETFSNFGFRTDANTLAHWRLDSVNVANFKTDLTGGGHDLTASGTPYDSLGSVIISGGYSKFFDSAIPEYYDIASDADFNIGTGDITVDFALTVKDFSSATVTVAGKALSNLSSGWRLAFDNAERLTLYAAQGGRALGFRTAVLSVGYITGSLALDRSGQTGVGYINGSANGSATVTSLLVSDNVTNGDAAYIGRYSFAGAYYESVLTEIRISKIQRTATEQKEIGMIAKDWYSNDGDVTRSSWGFYQGISGSGLTVGTKDGGITKAVPTTLTASSQRFLVNFPRANTFSSDSIMFFTSTDSIWHSVPDTVLAGGLGIQVELDAWETGGVVYLDNVTVRGYATTHKFKQHSAHSKFKGF